MDRVKGVQFYDQVRVREVWLRCPHDEEMARRG